MKKILFSFVFVCLGLLSTYGQGLIIHEQAGVKDTVILSAVDSVTFNQSMVVHKIGGAKDSVQLSAIDSVSYSTAINPAPKIISISPATISIGGPTFLLSVAGKRFLNSSIILWNGSPLNTEFVSTTELQATVAAELIDTGGSANISIFNPAPGGGTSAVKTFLIGVVTITYEGFEVGTKQGYAAAPVNLSTGTWILDNALIGKDANDVKHGIAAARVKLNGKMTMQFDLTTGAGTVKISHAKYGLDGATTWQLWYSTNSGSLWNQVGGTVNTVNKTLDTATFVLNITGLIRFEIRKTDTTSTYRINFDDITIGSYGSTSGNPVPVFSSMSPTSDTIGSGPFTLTVNGSKFIASSVVVWGTKTLATTYVSPTKLEATVQPVDMAAQGIVQVTVFTPNGGSSSPLTFTINPGVNSPIPVLRYISPVSCVPGSAGFTLTVTGKSFVAGSVVKWNSQNLQTTYISATQLTAQLPADNLVNAGNASVSVYTAPPSGGTSAAASFTIVAAPTPSTNLNLTMGNPSGAVHDANYPHNYLIERGQYCLSYQRDRGIPNWVSWQLDSSWIGSASRGSFKTDSTLPAGWYQVNTDDYSGTGLSRGHMCPSADRTRTEPDNDTVFYMTNMIPQSQAQNGGPWASLENYERSLALSGNEVYIYCGPYGEGGLGLNGYFTSIAGGKIAVPAKTWKVLLVLPAGTDDVSRVDTTTRCIGVIMDNNLGSFGTWSSTRVSVDQIEALTGLDFYSNVPKQIQAVIEAKVDAVPIP